MEVYFFQPLLNIKVGTALSDPWEVSVADDFGIGIVEAEALQKLYHRALLGFGSGIGRIAVGIQTALVTDSYRVGVVMLGMGTDHLLGTAWVDFAILGDVVVITGGLETSRLMTGFEVFDREISVGSGCRAVNND